MNAHQCRWASNWGETCGNLQITYANKHTHTRAHTQIHTHTHKYAHTHTHTHDTLAQALRKYSVVPVVTRKLASDDVMMGHKLPAGIMVACVLQVCLCGGGGGGGCMIGWVGGWCLGVDV